MRWEGSEAQAVLLVRQERQATWATKATWLAAAAQCPACQHTTMVVIKTDGRCGECYVDDAMRLP
jgi:hypothetical protein